MKRSFLFAIAAQAITIVVLVLLGFQYFGQIASLREYTQKIDHTYKTILHIASVQASIRDAETSGRGFLLTDDKNFLKQMSDAAAKVLPQTDSLRMLIKDNPKQQDILKRVNKLSYDKIALVLENCYIKNRISVDSLRKRLNTGKLKMDSIDYYFTSMRKNEILLLQERKELKRRFEAMLPRSLQIAFITCIVLVLVFSLWIFIELKKRFHYQHQLQLKLGELRQNNEELEHIAFAASHDLQEPLRKIRVFSDRLLLPAIKATENDRQMMLQRINVAASSLQLLIADLVVFNQLVRNNYNKTSTNIKLVLQKSINHVFAGVADIVIEWQGQENYPHIYASEEQLNILFDELLKNALQFKATNKQLTIAITANTKNWRDIKGLPAEINQGSFFMLSIADNGIGFDPAFKHKMFKPFQRLHNLPTTETVSRKGMGLAMCKRVMLNTGGWIDAAGTPGQGALFSLYFPVSAT